MKKLCMRDVCLGEDIRFNALPCHRSKTQINFKSITYPVINKWGWWAVRQPFQRNTLVTRSNIHRSTLY